MTATAAEEEQTLRFEQYLDRAMDEVFGKMIGVCCSRTDQAVNPEGTIVSALIGLAGAMIGTLVLQSGCDAAIRISDHMTGMESGELDATVRDAMGEVANMVAGAWKSYDPAFSSKCLLSTPTVVAGSRYEVFSRRATIRIDRVYAFEDFTCTVTVSCALSA